MKLINPNRRVFQPTVLTILLAGVLLFTAPMSVMGSNIGWSPSSIDFGDVPYGTTETQIVRLENIGGDLLTITGIEWTYRDYYICDEPLGCPAFEWTGDISEPLLPGEWIDVEITFPPLTMG